MLEVLLNRLDDMERKLSELQIELKEHREEVERNRTPDCVSPTPAPPELNNSTSTTLPTTSTTQPTETDPPIYVSCQDTPIKVSGVYSIRVKNDSEPIKVYCEMEKFRGGWIVLQHRFDGSVDFYRDWVEYREGFGDLNSEFWLGLEHIHQLTTSRKFELIVELEDFNGNSGYARYNTFQIGSENDKYRLKTVGPYTGSIGDSLIQQQGRMFSTKDRDNDQSTQNWAVYCQGAWWHGGIDAYSNLNGPYNETNVFKTNFWYRFKGYRGMSFTRMMIREL